MEMSLKPRGVHLGHINRVCACAAEKHEVVGGNPPVQKYVHSNLVGQNVSMEHLTAQNRMLIVFLHPRFELVVIRLVTLIKNKG